MAYPSAQELIPHAGPAVLIDTVVDDGPEHIVATATVDPHSPYCEKDKGMPVWVGIEIMSQAVAAHAGLVSARNGGAPRRGMLLGTRAYEATVAWFAPGSELTLYAEHAFGDSNGMSACACRIEIEQRVVVTATLLLVSETAA